MEKEEAAFKAIDEICGRCPKRSSCSFGQSAFHTPTSNINNEDKAGMIKYIWYKKGADALIICPNPQEITDAMKILKDQQGQNSEKASQ